MKRQRNCLRPPVGECLPRTSKDLPSGSEGAGRKALVASSPELQPASPLVSSVTLGKSLPITDTEVLAQESEGL